MRTLAFVRRAKAGPKHLVEVSGVGSVARAAACRLPAAHGRAVPCLDHERIWTGRTRAGCARRLRCRAVFGSAEKASIRLALCTTPYDVVHIVLKQ
jgi:hypothetical protein